MVVFGVFRLCDWCKGAHDISYQDGCHHEVVNAYKCLRLGILLGKQDTKGIRSLNFRSNHTTPIIMSGKNFQ